MLQNSDTYLPTIKKFENGRIIAEDVLSNFDQVGKSI